VRLVGFDIQSKDYDYQSALMSLPQKLGLQPHEAIALPAYLNVGSEISQQWKSRVGKSPSLKVGLCWQGNPKFPEDKLRSIPLKSFEPLLEIENVDFFSLQKDFGSEQITNTAFKNKIYDYTQRFDSGESIFVDVAALMKSLDLIVSIDSAIAHLGGALGCKTRILLPKISDWRWGLEHHDRPWYQSVKLVRQDHFFDWSEVISKIKSEIQTLIHPMQEFFG
jgi:hypothetical protein